MPNLIEMKASFSSASSTGRPGVSELPSDAEVTINKLIGLLENVKEVKFYWDNIRETHTLSPNRLIIEAHYRKTIAKSRRIKKLLVFPSGEPSESDVVGVRFGENDCHIISYAIPNESLEDTINYLESCVEYMREQRVESFTTNTLHYFNENKRDWNGEKIEKELKKHNLTKSGFARTIVDAYYVNKFSGPEEFEVSNDDRVVTFFKLDDDANNLLKLAGLDGKGLKLLDNSVSLSRGLQAILYDNAPYLVSMSVQNFAEVPDFEVRDGDEISFAIPDPDDEPIIGVIDTQFKEDVYFKNWVDYVNVLGDGVEYRDEDYAHGTAVSSIIVDGPRFNRKLDDNCGRFRVKHFGVGTKHNINIFTVASKLENWVKENPDIHVWNVSLGTISEVERNSISFLASIVDKIQVKYNVIFIIAGTNDIDNTLSKKIGSPADSINSLVVNSVNSCGEIPSYARKGPVLSFFMKPDVCAFGGDDGDEMLVYGFVGTRLTHGTSFAAPWIARKMAFLVDRMRISIPVAKALIIDSAITWEDDITKKEHEYYGYGIVPIKIEDVLNSKKDEIKFYLNVNVNDYHTYLYDIPVPLVNNKFPFIAKATMCYMSECSRNYGVDYTNTELDFKFGRVKETGTVDSVNDDRQYDRGYFTFEEDSRRFFRKWDNVKNIVQELRPRIRDKMRFGDQLWGIDIKMANRNTMEKQGDIKVGIVVTLKELHGVNRNDAFIQYCRLRHFIINEIDIENRVELDNVLQQDIEILN